MHKFKILIPVLRGIMRAKAALLALPKVPSMSNSYRVVLVSSCSAMCVTLSSLRLKWIKHKHRRLADWHNRRNVEERRMVGTSPSVGGCVRSETGASMKAVGAKSREPKIRTCCNLGSVASVSTNGSNQHTCSVGQLGLRLDCSVSLPRKETLSRKTLSRVFSSRRESASTTNS